MCVGDEQEGIYEGKERREKEKGEIVKSDRCDKVKQSVVEGIMRETE